MTLQIRVDGPSGSRVVAVPAGGLPLVAGRSAEADIALPDPERLLSRKHLVFRARYDSVEVTVVSSGSGATTSHGELLPGQAAVLYPGEQVALGRYTITIESGEQVCEELGAGAAGEDGGGSIERPLGVGGSGTSVPEAPATVSIWVGSRLPVPPTGAPGPHAAHPQAIDEALRRIDGVDSGSPVTPDIAAKAVEDFIGVGDARGQGRWDNSPQVDLPRSPGPIEVHVYDPASQPRDERRMTSWPVQAPGRSKDESDVWQRLRAGLSAATPNSDVAPPPLPTTSNGGHLGYDPVAALGQPPPITAPALRLDVEAFALGLGVPLPEDIGPEDWKRIGSTLRYMVEGFSQLMSARAALKSQLGAHNKTEMYLRDNNPFKVHLAVDEALRQLLFNSNRTSAYVSADRAVREAAEDLLTHDLAIVAASRACVEGILKEFDPQRLLTALEANQPISRLQQLREARLWRSYCAHFGEKRAHMADWIEELFREHFLTAYSRETERLSQQHVSLP